MFSASGAIQEYIEVISINLLSAELRLRICERAAFSNCGYDDDGAVVAALVPDLVRAANEIETISPRITEDREWLSLKARLHWLASGFYLWWSRMSQNIRESREAESRGLEHIGEVIRTLRLPQEHPILSVRTPQLESLARSEQHWKVLSESSLSSFRDEIQASSIVSIARERFIEEVGGMEQRVAMLGEEADSREVTDDEKARLAAIGSDLLTRYGIPAEGTNQKLYELIDDFLEISGEALLVTVADKDDASSQQQWGKVWDLLPSALPPINNVLSTPNPSILSVVGICMHAMKGNTLSLLSFLSHLALAGYECLGILVQKPSGGASFTENTFHDDDCFSDSDDSFLSDDAAKNDRKQDEEIGVQQYTRALQFLIEKIADIYEKNAVSEDLSSYLSSKECLSVVHFSLAFSAEYYKYATDKTAILNAPLDFDVFLSIQKFVTSLLDSNASETSKRFLEYVFFGGLARILISQREAFPSILRPSGTRMGRAIRQKVCLNRAEYIGAVASEMAYMLSIARSVLLSGKMNSPYLIRDNSLAPASSSEDGESMSSFSMSRLATLSESVLWLWKYMAVHESDETLTVRLSGHAGVSSFDRPIIETMYSPVASLIIGLCGSATTTRSLTRHELVMPTGGTDRLCLSEFYDSDASSTDLVLDTTDDKNTSTTEVKRFKTELLRGICHAVHCIALVSCELNSKVSTSYQSPTRGGCHLGPHLPLVASRVANHFADILLSEFGAEEIPSLRWKNLWVTEYPYGARSIGALIDFTLHKAYRALHGFVLTGGSTQQAITGMERLAASNDDITPSQVAKPESTLAVAQLYRCILRAYTSVRKSPPKEALECVASALPAVDDSERSRVIRRFLFSGDCEYFSHRDVIDLLNRGSEQAQTNSALPDWVWEMEQPPGLESGVGKHVDREMEDAFLVRKGICHELAQGPLPLLSGSSTDGTKAAKSTAQDSTLEERIVAISNEEELSKKFDAIVDDLCYGDPVNSKGWYDASQCLLMKADLTADRLGLSKGFSRARDFHVPVTRIDLEFKSTLAHLIDEQGKEFERNSQGWITYLGNDLSVYIHHQWASFSSLRKCFDEIGSGYSDTLKGGLVDEDNYAAHVLQEIGSLYDKGDYIGWQQAWGGLFVGALRKMSLRCMFIALYLLRRQDSELGSEGLLTSEIAESLGIFYYSELMASQVYGYPMHVMTDHQKRRFAETALTCFQFAVDALGAATNDKNPETRQTWDLAFMKGKVRQFFPILIYPLSDLNASHYSLISAMKKLLLPTRRRRFLIDSSCQQMEVNLLELMNVT